ncbi:MAG: hypothetical protein V4659_07190 [Pseudomonadota bacterium]
MSNPEFYITMAMSGLAGLAMLVVAGLSGWRGWLALKRQELAAQGETHTPAPNNAAARIEMADLKERLKKLEAIAAGVEL